MLSGLRRRLELAPARYRWPVKWAILLVVTFGALFPHPGLFLRHIRHFRQLDSLPDPADPALAPMAARFESFLDEKGLASADASVLLREVETFVRREIPYGWDWEVWGVADYIPTVSEVIARGREDCDGRAVLAAALLRHKGVPAELVADTRHMWVRAPEGETMDPLGPPILQAQDGQVRVRWSGLIDLGPPAYGVAVFPLGRELIILLTLWVLLLPWRVDRRSALLALGLMLQGLVLIRTAGTDPLAPWRGGILLGLLSLSLPVAGLWLVRLRHRPVAAPQPASLAALEESS
ncbi:MAG TPA: hypothetical protein PL151_20015 [Phycisphaerae bacterium]|nr:hypothetical protein [Phycisphaerae bacterium]HOJ75626.1 hypothetical protein [Phycisphaerae bacterium]HOM52494.1 hypothetical protein [Phycisphaerae bacterium]HON65363.1 hypothetical protein [Phycisphaerae bacterium]HPP27768.1 hypothetical protein [Phycisphaerae bacterium]